MIVILGAPRLSAFIQKIEQINEKKRLRRENRPNFGGNFLGDSSERQVEDSVPVLTSTDWYYIEDEIKTLQDGVHKGFFCASNIVVRDGMHTRETLLEVLNSLVDMYTFHVGDSKNITAFEALKANIRRLQEEAKAALEREEIMAYQPPALSSPQATTLSLPPIMQPPPAQPSAAHPTPPGSGRTEAESHSEPLSGPPEIVEKKEIYLDQLAHFFEEGIKNLKFLQMRESLDRAYGATSDHPLLVPLRTYLTTVPIPGLKKQWIVKALIVDMSHLLAESPCPTDELMGLVAKAQCLNPRGCRNRLKGYLKTLANQFREDPTPSDVHEGGIAMQALSSGSPLKPASTLFAPPVLRPGHWLAQFESCTKKRGMDWGDFDARLQAAMNRLKGQMNNFCTSILSGYLEFHPKPGIEKIRLVKALILEMVPLNLPKDYTDLTASQKHALELLVTKAKALNPWGLSDRLGTRLETISFDINRAPCSHRITPLK